MKSLLMQHSSKDLKVIATGDEIQKQLTYHQGDVINVYNVKFGLFVC